jgi:hypothetical protein
MRVLLISRNVREVVYGGLRAQSRYSLDANDARAQTLEVVVVT